MQKKIRIAINGFGRIGRAFFRIAYNHPEIDLVAINDLDGPENLAYLARYDSAYGRSGLSVRADVIDDKNVFLIESSSGSKTISLFAEKDPKNLPWRELAIDIVIEATGVFASFEKSQAHRDAGAKRVVVTAPVKDEPPEGIIGATVLVGVNEEQLKTCDISSNASCTTNAGGPLVTILDEAIGIEKAILNTVHGYTSSQALVDGTNKKDFRRGRAAGVNIVPSTTGAAIAVTKAYPALQGKFDGIAMRVPVIVGSLVDVTFLAKKETSVAEVNEVLKKAAGEDRWKKTFAVTEEPIVSSDIVGSPHASIADLSFTRVVDGNLVKVLAWYDNELGYAHSLLEHVLKSGHYITA